jgi:hypothetical protein
VIKTLFLERGFLYEGSFLLKRREAQVAEAWINDYLDLYLYAKDR